MKRKKERLKLYMEAGLAVLLVIGLAAGGRAGLFEKAVNASEELTQTVQEDAGTDSGSEAENSAADASAGAEEAIADGQYPIMGSSSVTTQEMVDYFNASGETYPSEALSQGGADSIETFCQMYYDEACAEGVRPEVAFAQTMKET